jgi:hypothetical protein
MKHEQNKAQAYFRVYDALRGMMSPATMPIGILLVSPRQRDAFAACSRRSN